MNIEKEIKQINFVLGFIMIEMIVEGIAIIYLLNIV
jgi:hypothetical protein